MERQVRRIFVLNVKGYTPSKDENLTGRKTENIFPFERRIFGVL